jgi:ribokinase
VGIKDISVIVIGGLNVDIVARGAEKLLKSGELTYAKELHFGPGGKSRNIAQMIAELSGKKNVAMIGKTAQDPFGLWKLPYDSLKNVGVNTDYIDIVSSKDSDQFPGIALIPVDTEGNSQIYVIPGVNNSFIPQDIDRAEELFLAVAKNNGILVLTLELPYATAIYAVKKANSLGIKVLFDPGGIDEKKEYDELLAQKIFLIKPNEHEAKILTGIEIKDFETAKQAGEKLLDKGIENVFITCGAEGGYFFSKSVQKYIPTHNVQDDTVMDETGCGDETMAAIADSVSEGNDIVTAAGIGIVAGTLKFYKEGIDPITKQELNKYL